MSNTYKDRKGKNLYVEAVEKERKRKKKMEQKKRRVSFWAKMWNY